LEEARKLGDVSQPFPAFAGEADFVVAAYFPLDNPFLEGGQLFKGDQIAVWLAYLPLSSALGGIAGSRRGRRTRSRQIAGRTAL